MTNTNFKLKGKQIKNKNITIEVWIYILLAVAAVATTTMFSFCSPLYRHQVECDESCFITIAKAIMSGKMPYLDLFDHKGPMTYLLYLVGLVLTGNELGIWIISSIVNAISFIMLYKASRVYNNANSALAATVVGIAVILIRFTGYCIFNTGSHPEDLILPFFLYTYIVASKHFLLENSDHRFKNKEIVLMGLFSGIVFAIKYNLCYIWLFVLGSYFIMLLVKKEFKLFIKQALMYLGTIAISIIPLTIWLYMKGALGAMVKCYFKYNLSYASSSGNPFFLLRDDVIPQLKVILVVSTVLSLAALILKWKKAKVARHYFVAAFAIVVVSVFFLTFSKFYWYTMILAVPLFIPAFDMIGELTTRIIKQKFMHYAVVICVLVLAIMFSQFGNYYTFTALAPETEFYKKLKTLSAIEDVSIINFNSLATPIFDVTGTLPDKYIFYMPNLSTDEMLTLQTSYITNNEADVVVVSSLSYEGYDELINKYMISNNYTLFATTPQEETPDKPLMVYVLNTTLEEYSLD